MTLLKINGVVMPTPSAMMVGSQDIVKAERNARGTMIIEHIATRDKLELNWIYLTPAQLATLLNAMKEILFEVTYINPMTNTPKTALFYKGDRTMPIMDYINGILRYKDFKVNFIER